MEEKLEKKLMIKKFSKILIKNMPDDVTEFDGLKYDKASAGSYDMVLNFVFDLDEMEKEVHEISSKKLLNEDGYLYFAYPKKGNKKYSTFIGRDDIFPRLKVNDEDGFVEGTPLKFSLMVALNDTFTIVGMKYLPEGDVKKNTVSARVDDYVERIPELRSYLSNIPDILKIYDGLAPGYQKDWARYVYSTQTEATKEKRLSEMKDILKAGYKSKALYSQGKK